MPPPALITGLWLAWAAPALTLQLGGLKPSHRALQRVSRGSAAMRFADAAAFEAAVRAYVSTLDEKELQDPAAPSPLAYAELQRNGQLDLVAGCMEHGGYIQVSKRLGVPLRLPKEAEQPADAPRFIEALPPTLGLKLSGSKREADLAAAVQTLDLTRAAAPAPAGVRGGVVYEPTPLRLPRPKAAPSDIISSSTDARPRWELAWVFRYDGSQRAWLVFLVWLSAAGYGRATAEVLEPGIVSTMQATAQASDALSPSASVCE